MLLHEEIMASSTREHMSSILQSTNNNHEQQGQEKDRKPMWASTGTGTYIHCDLHVGALRSFSPGCLQKPAKQHSFFRHMEVEELSVPIPAVEGQLLCALREVLGDIHGV